MTDIARIISGVVVAIAIAVAVSTMDRRGRQHRQ